MKSKRLDFDLNFLNKNKSNSKPNISKNNNESDFDEFNGGVLKIAFITSAIICVIVVVVTYTVK